MTPVLAILSIAVRLDSRGPAIYRQERIGLRGQPFVMFKLRSMSADTVHDCRAKAPDDPRVTRVGRFLRRYSLDEVPQLANVALGNMAIIGPRPLLACDVGISNEDVRRLHVLPGITGLWQVSGRCTLSAEEMIRIDARYVDTWSHRLDAKIAMKTFKAVIRGDGAY
jgi:lipopolysaccharide/colanic/teichoic acid biosynthesis glycosyltransferase